MNAPRDDAALCCREYLGDATISVDTLWVRVRMHALPAGLESGWKLHLSSTPAAWPELLARALPLLAEAGVAFKCVRDAATLEALNEGAYGVAQAGKAFTLYPPDEAAAAALAGQLIEALAGLPGPAIVTDRHHGGDAPVYFRFGPYGHHERIDVLGRRRRQLRLPDGAWVDDPAEDGGATLVVPSVLPQAAPADHLAFLREAYLPVRVLQASPKGVALLALARTAPPGLCFIKTARAHAAADVHGRDAPWALRREAHWLQRFGDDPALPGAATLHRSPQGDVALVRAHLEGATLWEVVTAHDAQTEGQQHRLAAALRQLAGAVARWHAQGLVVRDLSPSNVLLTEDGVCVLDLELAHPLDDPAPPYRRGTLGFYAPDKSPGTAAALADDHYALLALLWLVGLGVHPGLLPEGVPQAWRRLGAALPRAWARALDARGRGDFVASFTSAVAAGPPALAAPALTTPADTAAESAATGYAAACRALLAAAHKPDSFEAYQVYDGKAGALLCALELHGFVAAHAEGVRAAAQATLEAAPRVAHIAGFYFGAPGMACAAYLAGRALGDAALQTRAEALLRAPHHLRARIPDMCHGAAGYVYALAVCAHRAADGAWLPLLREAAEGLAACRETGDEGHTFWPWPDEPDAGTLRGARLLGYGHGVAGVVDALLLAYAATQHAPLRLAAEAGLDTLEACARPVAAGHPARWWPHAPEDDACWNAWCHGTPGVVQTLVRAHAVLGQPRYTALARAGAAGMALANNPGVVRCHGRASRLEALCDLRDRGLLDDAGEALLAADCALLHALPVDHLHYAALEPTGAAPPPTRGLMTGPLGIWRTLWRAQGGAPASGSVLL